MTDRLAEGKGTFVSIYDLESNPRPSYKIIKDAFDKSKHGNNNN